MGKGGGLSLLGCTCCRWISVKELIPIPQCKPEPCHPLPHHCLNMQEFQLESMDLFLANMQLFVEGRQMLNIVDKRAGY